MAKDFLLQFAGLAITVGQPLVFSFADKKLLGLNIRSIDAIDANSIRDNKNVEPKKITFGRLSGNAVIQFEKADNSSINLVGKAKGWVKLWLLEQQVSEYCLIAAKWFVSLSSTQTGILEKWESVA